MKRLTLAAAGALVWMIVLAVPAFAGSELPAPGGGADVGGEVITPGAGGVPAFTGTNISLGALLAAVMLVVGIVLLIAARRRASSAS